MQELPAHPDAPAGLERQRRDVGAGDLPLSVPGREAVPVRPGGQGGEQRRRLRDVDEQVRDRLLEVGEPRSVLDGADQGLGQPVGRQAVDRGQPRRRSRLRRVRDGTGRLGRGIAQLGRVVPRRRQAQHRQRPLPLPERAGGAVERRRDALGIGVSRQPAGKRCDHDRDVEVDERRRAWSRTVLAKCSRGSTSRRPRRRPSRATPPARSWRCTRARRAVGRERSRLDASLNRRGGDLGARRSRSGTAWPTRRSPRSRVGQRAISDCTTATTGPVRGTRGIARRPTAARVGARRPTSPTPTPAPRTRRRRGSRRSTATTARSTSRTPARPSRVWGEGASFSAGPGGIWFNRQT